MLFAHDTEVALAAAAALVNTDDPDEEGLPDTGALAAFVARWGWTGRHERTEADPAHAWLRERVLAAAASQESEEPISLRG